MVSCNPCHVLGPLMGEAHNTVWQKRIGAMLMGESGHEDRENILWNIVDNRDIAESQRLMATSEVAANGSRYMLVATDESGELTAQELIDTLREMYPHIDVAGDYVPPPTPDHPRAKCRKAMRELGLRTHGVRDTLAATVDSLIDAAGVVPKLR